MNPGKQELQIAALTFDDVEIEELVLRFNAVTAKEGMDVDDLGGETTDDELAETLRETPGDLSRHETTREKESINHGQKDALVALFWIGRGDAEPEEWGATRALARRQHDGLISRDLLGQPEIGEFLTEGLEKMLEFGVEWPQRVTPATDRVLSVLRLHILA